MKIASCFSIWPRKWPIGSSFVRSAPASNTSQDNEKGRILQHLRPFPLFGWLGIVKFSTPPWKPILPLLPLDRAWWFAADVVHHTRHSRHFIHDPRRHPLQYFSWQPPPVRRHRVIRLHHPYRHR